MKLFDVNVLLDSHREESPHHAVVRPWFEQQINQPSPFALSELVLSAFVRVATNPRAFPVPTLPADALAIVDQLRQRPNCVMVRPGPHHFDLFVKFCREHDARGNLVPDVYLAVLAIEHGCEWVSADGGFGRFEGLNWTRPPKAEKRSGDE